MSKQKNKIEIIDGIEQRNNIFKQQGKTLKFIDDHSLWMIIIILFVSLAVEMLIFACIYAVISWSPFWDGLDYSFLSTLGETAAEPVRNSTWVNWIIALQSVITDCIIAFFMAIVLYKLISIRPELIKMEDHVVFDPTTGTLRLRVANVSKFVLVNAHVIANFRIYIPESNRHANARLKLKTEDMVVFERYTAWNIATKPFQPEDGDSTRLDISKFDKDREYKFIPELLKEEYRSDNRRVARKTDYRNLDVVITIKSPLFGTDWVYYKSFTAKDFVCGKLVSIEDHGSGKIIMDWSGWGKYEDYIEKNYCEKCVFKEHCGIINKNEGQKTIN